MAELKSGTILVLKKDYPPFPIGTEFTISYGLAGEMLLKTPTFGTILPKGQKVPSMSVATYSEYAEVFKAFGGWQEWFDVKNNTVITEWSSHCIKFQGNPLNQDLIEEIEALVKANSYK